MNRHIVLITILLIGLLIFPIPAHAQSSPPVVRAVLFYSPTCGHCQMVINETLLPMTNQYGNQLQIMALDISQEQGWELFLGTLQKFGLNQGGVPFLVIDNIYLIGSGEIPERFPGLVESYLERGGVDWPDLPGLSAILPAPTEPSSPVPDSDSSGTSLDLAHQNDLTWRERFAHDPSGNTLAVIVLVGMFGATAWAYNLFQKTKGISMKARLSWVIPAVCLIGSGVAGYLAYVETAQVEAVCGPVGDCNTVQQSEYARLFGLLPIGVLGLVGYAAILLSWLVAHFTTGRPAELAPLAILGMTVFGTIFSLYLTFLEPFVIGATCAWCLTSAVLMTVLMLLSIPPAKLALSRQRKK